MGKRHIVCDTSALLEHLRVPRNCQQPESEVENLYQEFSKEFLYLPLATIVETGNAIAHCKGTDAGGKRVLAEKFVDLVRKCLDGTSPFRPIRFWDQERMLKICGQLPQNVTFKKGVGVADTSILQDCEELGCFVRDAHDLVLWTYDEDLKEKFNMLLPVWLAQNNR